jgi:NTE family protein
MTPGRSGRLLAIVAALLLAGCALRPATPALETADGAGYRWQTAAVKPGNDPETLLILTFSGGGTRAAAYAYGVLEELRRTRIALRDGREGSALDQVDVITSTSGGSFTALAFAQYGERLFDVYEQAFLKRDVEGQLIERLLNPLTWPRMLSQGFGRSELAEEYYDEILFKGATYRDLIGRPGPVAIVGATEVTTGSRIDFTQSQFDAMCIDLAGMRLSRAATASSAVPVIFTPVTFDNRGGRCGFRPPEWMAQAAREAPEQLLGNRAADRLRRMDSLGDSEQRPYIHLVDGGLSDNMGLVSVVQFLQEAMDNPAYRAAMRASNLRRIAIVVVNARSDPSYDYDRQPFGPDILQLLTQSVSVPMNRYSTESVAALRDVITEWRQRAELDADARRLGRPEPAGGALPAVEFTVAEVSFDAVSDATLRSYLQNLPTSFFLSGEAVDKLRDTAAQLLRDSPAFRRFVAELDGSAPAGSPAR